MFSTKKDVDKHVRTALAKLSEDEKKDRGYTIAKLYFKAMDYQSALNWVSNFLEVRESNSGAHRLLGQCFEKLKKPERALQAYQRSLQLDPKQAGLITDVCKLLLTDETLSTNPSRAKYWCDMAEKERIHNETVINLRVKLAGKTDSKVVEQLILQEIQSRPSEPTLRIRLIKFLIEEKRYQEAFKQCFDIEMKFVDSFAVSIDWYNTLNLALSKYAENNSGHKTNWNYWLLSVMAIERQIFLNLASDTMLVNVSRSNLKDVSALLFEFDQLLRRASECVMTVCQIRELAAQFLYHYRGQFLLHAASLLFKMEKVYSRNQWRDTTKKCLPLLLLAYQCGTADIEEPWLRTSNEQSRNLIKLWYRQGAFRCAQAGRTLLSCITEARENPVIAQIRQMTNNRTWETQEDLITHARQLCIDGNWRKNIFRQLFSHGDQVSKLSSSYFVQCDTMSEPMYEFPNIGDVENYEDIAQSLQPSCLQNQVFLSLGVTSMSEIRSCEVEGLNFSALNLNNCNADTLNQLDLDSFLCCTLFHTKRAIEAEKICYETYNDKPYDKPGILPITNMMDILCTEDQDEWWQAAYKILKNTAGENIAQLKAVLQNGIEAVRGEGSLKADLIILLKLAKTLAQRSQSTMQPEDKRHIETRAEHLYKVCLRRIKKGVTTGESRLIFKFSTSNYNIENEISELAEDAIQFLAARYFKNNEYNDLIDEFDGLEFPFATYFRAEAYKKLDETGKTSKKVKIINREKSKTCLLDTLSLLDDPQFKNHPLHSIVPSEIKRLQLSATGDLNVSNGFYDEEHEGRDSLSASFRSRGRNTSFSDKTTELEGLIRKMMEAMEIVKKEVVTIRSDITDMKDHINKIEENMNKKVAEEADLNDLYILDELQNQSNLQYDARATPIQANLQQMQQNEIFAQAARLSQYNQMYNTAYPMYMPPYGAPALPPQAMRPGAMGGAIPSPLQYQDPSMMHDPRNSLLMTATQSYYTPPQPNPINQVAPIMAAQQQLPMQQPKSALDLALQTPSLLNTWNTTYNQVIDKSPPVNVVITSSDPLPAYNTVSVQPKLSVTIPAQHIKNSQMSTMNDYSFKPAAPMMPSLENISPADVQPVQSSFNKSNNQNDSQLLEESPDYDPMPNFQPVIPLPDEVEVKTGEENEEVLFSSRAKLFRHVEKEWKERGVGDIKILKNKVNGQFRILMRRDQVHKICANHQIDPNMKLIVPKDTDKQFIWSANDFSEEKLQVEKFLVRFKEADIAKLFQSKFEDAKKELSNVKPKTSATITSNAAKTTPNLFAALTASSVSPTTAQQSTSALGSFTGSLTITPTKPLFTSTTIAPTEPAKSSPFASFTFGKVSDATKPLGSLFGNIGKSNDMTVTALTGTPIIQTLPTKVENNSLNKSVDDEDDYVPTATFTPVIALPELVETVTGEENENVMFEHRAKLFRFDRSTKEWKERGLGNIKILVNKNDLNKMRLLMRREQVFKLCCNQYLLKDTKFEKVDKPPSVRWHGPDYSENETQLEFLALRFKTIEVRDEFYDAVIKAQGNMSLDGSSKTEVTQEPAKQKEEGWGSKFKPKTGNWTCDGCYMSNDASKTECPACNTPKDKNQAPAAAKPIQGIDLSLPSTPPKFSFGFPPVNTQNDVKKDDKPSANTASGWGDKFKPKSGTWSCEGCYMSNDASKTECPACNTPRDKTAVNTAPKGIDLSVPAGTPKFSFGIPPKPANTDTPPSSNSSESKFSFGTPASSTGANFSLANTTFSSPGFSFGTPQAAPPPETTGTASGFSFSSAPTFADLAAKANNNADDEQSGFNFAPLEKGNFEFVFKPRSPGKPKSPCKSPGAVSEGEQTDDEYHEEENNTYFTPVVNLRPVEVKTGEEDEEVLYSHRAKLFRFDGETKEWKERGIGDIKVLMHKITGKLRVVMRREQIHKVCLNHILSGEVEYKIKDDKNWLFSVGDYSEGEVEVRSFCLRFKTHEIATDFKQAIDDALGDEARVMENGHGSEEDKAMNEDAKLVRKFKLPQDFYDYKKKDDCEGCRGCNSEEFKIPDYPSPVKIETELPLELTTIKLEGKPGRGYKPKRVSFSVDDSEEKDKTPNADLAKSIFSSALNTIPAAQTQSTKPAIFGSKEGGNIFGGTGFSPLIGNQNSIFGGTSTPNETKPTETKSLFGGTGSSDKAQTTSVFGGTGLFGRSTAESNKPPMFGSTPTFGNTLFSSQTTPTGSIFGGKPNFGAEPNAQPSTTPSNLSTGFSGTPVFGSLSTASSFSFAAAVKELDQNTPPTSDPNANQPTNNNSDPNENSPIPDLLKSETGPTFASIASATNNNAFAGASTGGKEGFFGLTVKEDIFSKLAKQKTGDGREEGDDSNANDENYDPHYDPIIQLPDEIQLSTGEEDEKKVFGERAKLYRYCADTKEWKERGVGELKILHHPQRGTYRFLMRREQIHKLVLNHVIAADFQINPMNTSGKAYLWGAMNYSEEGSNVEKLAARFKNEDLAIKFKFEVDKCIDTLKGRENLEPEED